MAFGNGLLFGVAVKLVQESIRAREGQTTGLSRLAERLNNMEDHDQQRQTIDREALSEPGEGFDRRVLDKVTVALEARLTEHVGHVNRRIAEMDAQVAVDLKAVLNHASSRSGAFEKAFQRIESEMRASLEAAGRQSAEQMSGVDVKLTALQDALAAKFREIVDAVRQSMEARLALELQAQAVPTQQALQQLETKLTTLRDELPPKIGQIIEAVETAMDARIVAGDTAVAEQVSAIDRRLTAWQEEVREPMEGVAQLRAALGAMSARLESGEQRAVQQAASLEEHATQGNALEQRLTALQEELPPKFRAIVDSVRQSMEARSAAELRTPVLEEGVAQLREALGTVTAKLESDDQRVGALDRKLSVLQEELPPKFKAIVDAVREGMDARVGAELQALEEQHREKIEFTEAKLTGEIQALEARALAGSAELEKALQYSSVLEARLEALEQRPQPSADETVDRAVERVWQSIEKRLLQRAEPSRPVESIGELRRKSANAEQSVLDLIAGIGQIFEKPSPPTPEPGNGNSAEHEREPEADDKPPVILFRPKETSRKWRIPFVSSSS